MRDRSCPRTEASRAYRALAQNSGHASFAADLKDAAVYIAAPQPLRGHILCEIADQAPPSHAEIEHRGLCQRCRPITAVSCLEIANEAVTLEIESFSGIADPIALQLFLGPIGKHGPDPRISVELFLQ